MTQYLKHPDVEKQEIVRRDGIIEPYISFVRHGLFQNQTRTPNPCNSTIIMRNKIGAKNTFIMSARSILSIALF